jgi:3-oxoacyl-[acyl-carrier protein] reductase
MITSGIQFDLDPVQWKKHFFGMSKKRWMYLNGKSFWITGAGTGYGRCLAIALAAAGGRVFLTGRRKDKLQETLSEMKQLNVPTDRCHEVVADITDFGQMSEACKKVASLAGFLYGLIHNAALPCHGDTKRPLLDGSVEAWQKIMATNITAPWFLTRTLFPNMVKGGEVRVLFISSEAGWAFTPGFGPYNVSKAALNSLGASLAAECVASCPEADIQMNILVPGEARTEMNQGSNESPYKIVPMALALLSHPRGGPNGKFFYWDGRCGSFCSSSPYPRSVS